MRGNPFTIVAVGIGAVMIPLILDVDVSGDDAGETILSLIGTLDLVVGLAFMVACLGLLVAYFTDSGF